MSIFGHNFLVITQLYFCQLSYNFSWELSRRFFDWQWEIQVIIACFHFWVTYVRNMGAATTRSTSGLGPKNPTKKLTHWVDVLGKLLCRNYDHVFSVFRDSPPPPLLWQRYIKKILIKIGPRLVLSSIFFYNFQYF